MSFSVNILFFLEIQTISSIFYIDTLSNIYPFHIKFTSITYILLYQNKLLCLFPVFTPNSDFITPLFHGYYTKYISYSYPFQIKFISITYTSAALCISCSRLYSPSISWILNQIHILLCVFHVVHPNRDLIIHLFNWYYRKYISNSY